MSPMERKTVLNAAEIMSRLPHRHPFLMLDSVFDLEPGKSASGIKNIAISDPVFTGHFPGEPIYPGVLLIEAAAHLCGLIVANVEDNTGPMIGYLAAVKKFRFKELVRPGDQIILSARAGAHIDGLSEFTTELKVGVKTVASGSLVIALPRI